MGIPATEVNGERIVQVFKIIRKKDIEKEEGKGDQSNC